MGESLEFINVLIRTEKLWKHNYKSALEEEGREPVFIHLMLYGDGFSWLDKSPKKSQFSKHKNHVCIYIYIYWIFSFTFSLDWQISACQFSRLLRSHKSSVANIPLLLCLESIMNSTHEVDNEEEYVLGSEILLGIYQKQLEKYATGTNKRPVSFII